MIVAQSSYPSRRHTRESVIPAKAGIQDWCVYLGGYRQFLAAACGSGNIKVFRFPLDSRLRGNDDGGHGPPYAQDFELAYGALYSNSRSIRLRHLGMSSSVTRAQSPIRFSRATRSARLYCSFNG